MLAVIGLEPQAQRVSSAPRSVASAGKSGLSASRVRASRAYEARNQATSRGLFSGAAHKQCPLEKFQQPFAVSRAKARGCRSRDQKSSAESASRNVSSTAG